MKKTKYTKELLIPIVKESNSYADVCRKLNVTPSTGAQTYITKRSRNITLILLFCRKRMT